MFTVYIMKDKDIVIELIYNIYKRHMLFNDSYDNIYCHYIKKLLTKYHIDDYSDLMYRYGAQNVFDLVHIIYTRSQQIVIIL